MRQIEEELRCQADELALEAISLEDHEADTPGQVVTAAKIKPLLAEEETHDDGTPVSWKKDQSSTSVMTGSYRFKS